MSLAVRHRYETMGPRPSVQYLCQQERIKMDESIAEREHENKLASDCNLKSDWKESAQGVCHVRILDYDIIKELKLTTPLDPTGPHLSRQ